MLFLLVAGALGVLGIGGVFVAALASQYPRKKDSP